MQPNPSPDRLPLRHRLVLGLLYLFLATEIFTAPLRFYLAPIGLSPLTYLPKILIVGVVIATVVRTLYRGRIRPLYGAVLAAFFVFGLVGVGFTRHPLQPAFGIFVLLPLIFAVIAEPILRQAGARILPYVSLLWLSVALGVVLDYLWEMPWAGLAYKLGELEIEGSREWSTFGVQRISGFSRASFQAADQLLFLSIPIVYFSRGHLMKLLIWLATGMLIYLTTTKKTGGAFLILTLLMPLMGATMVPALFRRALMAGMPFLVAAIGIGLPISTFFVAYRLDLDSLWSQALFASFEDRLTVVWPASLALALEHGSAVLGRGIGGIGAAQKYFEPLAFMPADNLFIYLFVTFGLLALAFVWVYVWNLARLDPDHGAWSRLMWTVGIAVLLNGLANNVLESPITAIFLGISMAYAYAAAQQSGHAAAQRWALRFGAAPRHTWRTSS